MHDKHITHILGRCKQCAEVYSAIFKQDVESGLLNVNELYSIDEPIIAVPSLLSI